MIDLKPTVLAALESDPALKALVGNRIYQLVAPDETPYPYITFFELNNYDSDYADDEDIESVISFQIDIWSKGSTTRMAKEVDRIIKYLGFIRTSTADFYEDDVQVYHKGMRYKKTETKEA